MIEGVLSEFIDGISDSISKITPVWLRVLVAIPTITVLVVAVMVLIIPLVVWRTIEGE